MKDATDMCRTDEQELLFLNSRKEKAVHKTTTTNDKRLQSTLKRVGANTIPGYEKVNIFKNDVVIQFQNSKVQASIAASTWVVSGTPQQKSCIPFVVVVSRQMP